MSKQKKPNALTITILQLFRVLGTVACGTQMRPPAVGGSKGYPWERK
jgi:hypothetical protein